MLTPRNEAAEAVVRWVECEESMNTLLIQPRGLPPTSEPNRGTVHTPQKGGGAARSTAGLYGDQGTKSSKTRPPGAGPRGLQTPQHQPRETGPVPRAKGPRRGNTPH